MNDQENVIVGKGDGMSKVRVYKGSEITKREAELHPALKDVIGFVSKEDYDRDMNTRQPEQAWIDVNDRLPEDTGRYWCYVAEINDLGLSHYQWNCGYNKGDNRWSSNAMPKTVTHWQPLSAKPVCEGG